MPIIRSPYPDLHIPQIDILSFLFPPDETPSNTPLWIDADDPSSYLTPRQLLQWVKRLGAGLSKLGIVPRRDVCMIYTPNHIFVPVAYLGIVGYGAAFSGCNPVYTIPEIAHQIRDTEARMILVHPSLVQSAIEAAEKAEFPREMLFLFSEREHATVRGVRDWRSMIGSPDEGRRWQWQRLSAHEATTRVATINYSSGTTGLPKGVCISHHSLIANVLQTIFIRDQEMPYNPSNRPEERWVGFLPLYHAYGQLYTILMATKLNTAVYIMASFQFERFLAVIQRYRITTLQTAPPILVMLSKRPETTRYDLSSVQDILCGAAPLKKELQNDVSTRFNVSITQGWGMTEVTCGAMSMPRGRFDDTGSVGVLLPNCQARLVDDDGRDVEPGVRGELYVRGPNVCLRYWKNDTATREALQNGWLKTGDVALVNEDGFFWIVDRKKELIKVNGLQVAPAELEATLLSHDAIADAAVVGITFNDDEWPRAYIVLKEASRGRVTEAAIQSWMVERVAKYKRLVGGVAFVDEVPKLASGKIQRKVMREWAKRDAEVLEGRGRGGPKL